VRKRIRREGIDRYTRIAQAVRKSLPSWHLIYLKLLRRAQFVSFDLLPPPSLEKWDRSLLSSLRLINNNSSKQDAKKNLIRQSAMIPQR
jgi:hypothetical protein